jgi:2-keto-4-pentenoate hydratase/2-oxohepta-3-ene-1,7-dioic acid hydratase in catechol pathway
MKLCRFFTEENASELPLRYGVLEGDRVKEIKGTPWNGWEPGTDTWATKNCHLVAPVEPSKIVCVGRNYAAHAAEMGNEVPVEPLIFFKPPSSIVGPDAPIVLTRYSQKVEHEGELGVVMAKKCSQLSDAADPLSYVLGYTCVNDVSARDIQKSDVQFARAKGFDTFCPIGPYIETQLDPANVLVETHVNGTRRQSGSTSLMIHPVEFLIRWISRMMTLQPGDVIATGTPAGVGALVAGDVVEIGVAGVGVLRNPVHAPLD